MSGAADLSVLAEDRALRMLILDAVAAASMGLSVATPSWRALIGNEAVWQYVNAMAEARRLTVAASPCATVSRNVKRKGER